VKQAVYRIIDANLNRAWEALRVCEEVLRFALDDKSATGSIKKLRHRITRITLSCVLDKAMLLKARQSKQDVGLRLRVKGLKRSNLRDVFFANIQRAKESLRVLEEFSKVSDPRAAPSFSRARFHLYALEKTIGSKILKRL
jgi:thiamine-phosphate pyrophosphorylase